MGLRALALLLARSGSAPLRAKSIRLDAATVQGDGPKWIQVAAAGQFLGHKSGPFTLDEKVFDQIVTNFRANPSFKPGAESAPPEQVNGGVFDVVAFDWRHASEQPPSTPETQAAYGWALDLDVRKGEDGNAQLWALARFLEPARTMIREQRIKWTSVAIWPNSKDPITNKDIGWYLSSIALTNDPFIQGMVPIAAARSYDPWNAPSSAEELVECLRGMFELSPTSGLPEVLAELTKLKAFATGAVAAPPGVDTVELVGDLRRMFNLPTMSSVDEVFAEADKLLGALAEEQAAKTGGGTLSRDSNLLTGGSLGGSPFSLTFQKPSNPQGNPALAGRENNVDLIALIASRLGVPHTAEAVRDAILVKLDAGEKASKNLAAVLGALGVGDVDQGVAKIAGMFKSVKSLEDAMPELAAFYKAQSEDETGKTEKDVDEAMQAHRLPAEARPALLHMRTGGIEAPSAQSATREQTVAFLASRAAARAKFLTQYPLPAQALPPADQMHLTRTFFATSGNGFVPPQAQGGQAYHSPLLRDLGANRAGGAFPAPAPGAGVIDLSRYPGVNSIEKAKAYVLENGGDKLGYDDLMERATIIAEQASGHQG